MPSLPKPPLSPEEYLELERQAELKSEYLDGEIFAMSGASREHNLIVLNVGAELRDQLKGRPCEAYVNDLRVKVSPTGLYTYPDVVVVCGEPQFEDDGIDTLINPTVIIEVLSPSTAGYDRTVKFEHYRQLDSLREYVLIAQDRVWVERFARQGELWTLTDANELGQTLRLESLGCELALRDVYERVGLSSPGKPGGPR